MLASFVVALRIEEALALPGLGGEALHGFFFEILREYDPAFAEHLHNLDGERPFSLSGVLGHYPKQQGSLHIPPDARVEFRLGLLTDDLIEHTLAAFARLTTSGATLRLGPSAARVEGMAFQAGAHPLVRAATYPALVQAAADSPAVTLRFHSPTSFRSGHDQELLPRPERVFGSLLAAWQAFAPTPFDPALAEVLPLVRVSAYELRTELVHFGRYKVIGFKGRVTYTCGRDADTTTRRALNALADFAFYAGVGYKTTMGLGQVSRERPTDGR
jgi:CRISPR-associated endoribonuclease Cas6